jgi:hypothetical protein
MFPTSELCRRSFGVGAREMLRSSFLLPEIPFIGDHGRWKTRPMSSTNIGYKQNMACDVMRTEFSNTFRRISGYNGCFDV